MSDEAVMKRSTTTEPIYDLPCVTKCSSEMNKKFSEISNSDVNGNKPEEGLHYLVSLILDFCLFTSGHRVPINVT